MQTSRKLNKLFPFSPTVADFGKRTWKVISTRDSYSSRSRKSTITIIVDVVERSQLIAHRLRVVGENRVDDDVLCQRQKQARFVRHIHNHIQHSGRCISRRLHCIPRADAEGHSNHTLTHTHCTHWVQAPPPTKAGPHFRQVCLLSISSPNYRNHLRNALGSDADQRRAASSNSVCSSIENFSGRKKISRSRCTSFPKSSDRVLQPEPRVAGALTPAPYAPRTQRLSACFQVAADESDCRLQWNCGLLSEEAHVDPDPLHSDDRNAPIGISPYYKQLLDSVELVRRSSKSPRKIIRPGKR